MKLGIDLGTSYSSIAAEIDGKIEMIKVSTGASAFGDSFSMPTAVYLDNGKMVLGQAALGKRKILPSCFKNEFKRDLGTTTPYVISGEEYLPEHLYTEIFLYFKEQALKQTGEKIDKVYLTHPANYGNNKKRLIEKAAGNAGLFDIILIDEPTAAAAGYSRKNKIVEGDILLVYDLGGGTFDTALIKKTSKGYIHLTEPLGISQCGGVDFDRVIFEDIMCKMARKGGFDTEKLLLEKRFTASLYEICTQIKHQLSHSENHTEPIAVGAFYYFEYTITRQEFEEMIIPLISNTCEKVKDILKNSGLSPSDIDRVLLVGGSSRIPVVQKMVGEVLQKEVYFDADPELAVCQGAISLDILNGRNRGEMHSEEERKAEGKRKEEERRRTEEKRKAEEAKRTEEIRKAEEAEAKRIEEERKAQEKRRIEEERIAEEKRRIEDERKAEEKRRAEEIREAEEAEAKRIEEERKAQEERMLEEERKAEEKQRLEELKIKERMDKTYPVKKPEEMEAILAGVIFGEYAYDGRWIYYVDDYDIIEGEPVNTRCLYRIKTDGTCRTKLNDNITEYPVKIEGDWIYYTVYTPGTNNSGRRNFYRIRKDGMWETVISKACTNKKEQKSVNEYCEYALSRGWIFFANEQNYLTRMSVDGSHITRILQDPCSPVIRSLTLREDILYYCDNGKLFKIDMDGKNKTEISSIDNESRIAFYYDFIFYINSRRMLLNMSRKELWKIRVDGEVNLKAADNFTSDKMNVIDDYIYFMNKSSLCRMPVDGKKTEVVKLPVMLDVIKGIAK